MKTVTLGHAGTVGLAPILCRGGRWRSPSAAWTKTRYEPPPPLPRLLFLRFLYVAVTTIVVAKISENMSCGS